MKVLDLLAKLGVLRYGATAAVYHSGEDRPIELMSDDVYDARRDLVTGADLKTDAEREADAKAAVADILAELAEPSKTRH